MTNVFKGKSSVRSETVVIDKILKQALHFDCLDYDLSYVHDNDKKQNETRYQDKNV